MDGLTGVHKIIPLEAGDALHVFQEAGEDDEHDATQGGAGMAFSPSTALIASLPQVRRKWGPNIGLLPFV